jgi:uncharacterized membrane protein YcaP (DUF421 family)
MIFLQKIFFENWESLFRTAVLCILGYVSLVILLRISGKRSLSQINEFDFIVTIALGSTLASVILNKDITLLDGILAFSLLLFLQFLASTLSSRFLKFRKIITSEPTLIYFQGKFLKQALKKLRLSELDVYSVIRSNGIGELKEVDSIIMESNGTISVVKKGSDLNDPIYSRVEIKGLDQ